MNNTDRIAALAKALTLQNQALKNLLVRVSKLEAEQLQRLQQKPERKGDRK